MFSQLVTLYLMPVFHIYIPAAQTASTRGGTGARRARFPAKGRSRSRSYALRPTRPNCGVAASVWRSLVQTFGSPAYNY